MADKSEKAVKHRRNPKTATGESATTAQTIAGLDPEKAIGLKSIPKVSENYTDPRVDSSNSDSDWLKMSPIERYKYGQRQQEQVKAIRDNQRANMERKLTIAGGKTEVSEHTTQTLRDLDRADVEAAQDAESRMAKYVGANSKDPEAGKIVANTKHPMVTSSKPGFAERGEEPYKKPEGASRAGRGTREGYEQLMRNVEGAKTVGETEVAKGHLRNTSLPVPHDAGTFCAGTGCKNRISGHDSFAEAHDAGEIEWVQKPGASQGVKHAVRRGAPITGGADAPKYCGGSECNTLKGRLTPTPRPGKDGVA